MNSDLPSGDSPTLLDQARNLYKAGRLADSRVAFTRLIEAGNPADGFYGLGVVEMKEGAFVAAAAHFRNSLDADPRNANAYYYLGEIAEKQHRPGEAEGFYKKAVELSPDHLGARRKLDAGRPAAPAQAAAPPAQAPAAPPVGGIYEVIRNDPSVMARQTLDLIDSLALSTAPRLSAFAWPIAMRLAGVILAPVLFPILFNLLLRRPPLGRIDSPFWAWLVPGVIAVLLAVDLVIYILRRTTTRFTFDKGRLLIARGLFARQETNIELYRVEDVSLAQSLANRITGDGVLWLTIARHAGNQKEPLQGLAGIEKLRDILERLRNLVLLLRTGAWGKGVIY